MPQKTINILLVEDNPGDVAFLSRMLAKGGNFSFNLTTIELLSQFPRFPTKDQFDIILLDLSLPDSQGLQTFTLVQGLAPGVPIVVLTGLDDEELGIQAVRLGAQDYLVKGQVDKNLLIRAFRYAIERKHTEERLLAYQKQLRTLASKLSRTEEQERRNIANDLHDNLAQNLAIAKMRLGPLLKTSAVGEISDSLNEIRTLIGQAIKYTRSLIFEISSPVLYTLGFESAIESLIEHFEAQYHLPISFEKDQWPKPLDDDIQGVLFRAVRELLINTVKHAEASEVSVSIQKINNHIRIKVEDNGRGFDPSQIRLNGEESGGFGLFHIRERIDFLGGAFEINAQSGHGTCVTLQVPLKGSIKRHDNKGVNKIYEY
jgi:signal transduction histidine kinase